MAGLEEDKEADKPESIAEQLCPVRMHNGKPCGRPILATPLGMDEEPVCLMHCKDPNKSNAGFQEEFERILRDAAQGDADFTRFVFPNADYTGREFKAKCTFGFATFTQKAIFSAATFVQNASFHEAKFAREAYFSWVKFSQQAYFHNAMFMQYANFSGAEFIQDAVFVEATFMQDISLDDASFTQNAYFSRATFKQDAYFTRATFTREVYFDKTAFEKISEFSGATFERRAEFRGTRFRDNNEAQPGPLFSLARFEKPELVLFYKTYLGQALFHNCDVSRVQFSSVQWRGRQENNKRMVFEEVLDTKGEAVGALRTDDDNPNERNYDLIAELYQQLKKNYDDKRDYWTAGDFHYGEMEMKRLSSPCRNPVLRWLHRNLGLAAWYQYASDYGESYVKPFLRLLLVLALFAIIYPACGLHRVSSEKGSPPRPVVQTSAVTTDTSEINYANFFQFLTAYQNGNLRGTVGFFVQSAMTSVSAASLRRDFADYEPQSVLGRFAALVELLLTSTLVALFLLAVRRQFRR